MLHAERGSVFAEYVILLLMVSLGCFAAAASLGPALLRLFLIQEAVLMLPIPL